MLPNPPRLQRGVGCQLFVTINASTHIFRRQCRDQRNDKYFNRNRITSYKLKTTNPLLQTRGSRVESLSTPKSPTFYTANFVANLKGSFMNMKRILLIILLLSSVDTFADEWRIPKIASYFSENKHFMLIVHPLETGETKSSYFSDKPLKNVDSNCRDTALTPCHAILYRIDKNDTTKIWKQRLINLESPGHVIVANDGMSIVTFDTWYSKRYGIDAMVIYGKNGELIQRFNLEDFSPFSLDEYERAMINFIFWRSGAKYINNHVIEISFKNGKDIEKTRKYNLKKKNFE